MKKSATLKLAPSQVKSSVARLRSGRVNLPGSVVPCLQFLDPLGIDVKADHSAAGTGKGSGHGQADIT